MPPRISILFLGNWDWYLYNFRLSLACYLRDNARADITFMCPDGPYRPLIEAQGFRWLPMPMERQGINPLKELGLLLRLRHALRTLRPDVVHNFTIKPVVWGSLAARLAGVPAIINAISGMGSIFRGNSYKARMARRPVAWLMRLALKSTRVHTIFQNPDDQELTARLCGLDPARVSLIRGSGVDPSRFTPSSTPPSSPVVLFIGRLLTDKGIHDFCTAAAEVHQTHPQVRFRLAGAPDPGNPSSLSAASLEELKRQQPYLEFLGHVEDPVRCYQESSMAVLPSYGEGVPRSLIEAAACGLPLIATNVPGCREIVKDNDNGILVPPKDPPSLAQAIRRLVDDPGLGAAWGRRGRLLVEAEFSERSVLAATLEIHRALLGSDQPR